MNYFLLACFLIYFLLNESPELYPILLSVMLYYSLRGTAVAFEHILKDSDHQLNVDKLCLISPETCLHCLVWKHIGLSERPPKSLLLWKKEMSWFSERCLMSLLTHIGNIYEIYVTAGFSVTDIP